MGSSITVGKNVRSSAAINYNGALSVNTQNRGEENQSDLASGSVSYYRIVGEHFL